MISILIYTDITSSLPNMKIFPITNGAAHEFTKKCRMFPKNCKKNSFQRRFWLLLPLATAIPDHEKFQKNANELLE